MASTCSADVSMFLGTLDMSDPNLIKIDRSRRAERLSRGRSAVVSITDYKNAID